jgi:hypothetical protein
MGLYSKDTTKRHVICFSAIFFVTFLIYWNSLQGGFIWDDRGLILDSTTYLEDWKNIFSSFTKPFFGTTPFYRPLLIVSFLLDYQLWGLNAFGYHCNNVFFHACNACMVYLLAFILFKERIVALSTGLLFISHPIQTEAVAWISGRNDVLLTFFSLITIIFFLKWRQSGGRNRVFTYSGFLLGYCCVLFTKESGIILPLLIGLIGYFFRNNFPHQAGINRKIYVPLTVISVLYIFVRMNLLESANFERGGLDTFQIVSGVIITYGYYFKMLLFPVFQTASPTIIPLSPSALTPAFLYAFVLAGLLMVVTVACWKRFGELSFLILWISITLLPVSGIVPLMVPALEHRLYLGSVCFSMAIPLVLYRMTLWDNKGFSFSGKSLCSLYLLLALILVYSVKTVTRNTIWQDEQTFWVETLQASPSSAFAHNNLGVVYARHGNHNKAIRVFKRGLSLPNGGEFSVGVAAKGIRLKMYNNLGESYRSLLEEQLAQEVTRKEKAIPGGGTTLEKPEGT